MKAWKRDIDPTSKTEEIFFDNGDTLPAHFNIDSKDIKEGKKIGKGNWTVHEAKWLGRKVAVKKFDIDSTFGNVSLTSKEVNRMLNLRHPNVLKLLGFYLTAQKEQVLDCTMIMELMDFDLEDYIGRGSLLDDQVVYIIAEVARGMNHIHKKGCLHRDLKPKNVLLRKSIVTGFNVDVKIADFGSSELMGGGNIDRTAGTMGYKAPEQFDSASKLFPSKVDVFGFGALCFKILTGEKPYKSPKNVQEVIKQIDKATISQRNLPEEVVEIIWECLDVNPELRPDFEKISNILDGALSAIRDKMALPLSPSTSTSLHSKESMPKISRIFDDALSAIRDKMPRLFPLSTSTSLHSKESMSKGVQGHDHLESILSEMGLSKEHAIHFIPSEELLVIEMRGAGSTARVYKVKWKGIFYAQKSFDGVPAMEFSTLGENYFQNFLKLCHKNIVTFMGFSVTSDNRLSIIMELLEMDLHTALDSHGFRRRNPGLDIQKRWTIVREIAEGMKYLHDRGVMHGDLKPWNVVVSALDTDDMVVKLIDFATDPMCCAERYAAPEILKNRQSMDVDSKRADMYSFGILCQEILGGARLHEYSNLKKYKEAILLGRRPPMPSGISPEMECLIKSCWNGDPQERPNFTEVCRRLDFFGFNVVAEE